MIATFKLKNANPKHYFITQNTNRMNILKSILISLLTLLSFQQFFAQQDPQYTMYMFNTMSVNSAYAGTRGYTSIVGLHRSQWVGLDGAPRTQTLAIDGPVSKRVGLGLSVVNDEVGPSDEFYIDGNFSYTIPVDNNYKLALGLKGGLRIFNVDFSVGSTQVSDRAFQNIENKLLPTVGVGLYLFSNNKYFGLSVPNFLRDEHYDSQMRTVAEERLHLFIIGGWVFDVSRNTKFKPAFLVKHVSGAPLSVDLSANFLFNERFRLGASYRWDDAISAMVGFDLGRRLLIAYAYDYTTTELSNYNNGTHEITLRFNIFKDKILKSPRFF